MYERKYGERYNQTLDIVDIAKLVRKEIRLNMPEIKVSVTTERFSGGQSLDVHIKECDFWIMQSESNVTRERYTPEAIEVIESIRRLIAGYNHNGSEIQVDYFDVNFYSNVSFDWQLEKAQAAMKGA